MDVKSELAARRASLAAMLETAHGRPADAMILICRDSVGWEDIYYYTGFIGSASVLLCIRGEFTLIVDRRYAEEALSIGTVPVAVCGGESGGARSPLEAASDTLIAAKIKRLAYAGIAYPLNVALSLERSLGSSLETVDVSPFIFNARRRKSANECDMITRAVQIASAAFEETLRSAREGMTEREFASMLIYGMNVRGADMFSPPPVMVTSGERTSLPHASPSGRRMQRGDLVIVDFCARAAGYVCDITRMFCVGEMPQDALRLWSVLRWAQASASMSLHAGTNASDADLAARTVIEAAGAEAFFTHGTGHGLGLSVHELPAISPASSYAFAEGDVVTVEPGLYIPGRFGMRIEDDYLITKNGAVCLTDSLARELRIVK